MHKDMIDSIKSFFEEEIMLFWDMTTIESKRQYEQRVCTDETIQKKECWAARKQWQWRTSNKW